MSSRRSSTSLRLRSSSLPYMSTAWSSVSRVRREARRAPAPAARRFARAVAPRLRGTAPTVHRRQHRKCPDAGTRRCAADVQRPSAAGGHKDSDRYRFTNFTTAQPLFRCLARLGRGKVIPVTVLSVDRLGVGSQLQGGEPQDLPVDLQKGACWGNLPSTRTKATWYAKPNRLWRPRRKAISRRSASRKLASRIRRGGWVPHGGRPGA